MTLKMVVFDFRDCCDCESEEGCSNCFLEVPAKRVVCSRCNGTGRHDPEAWSNGLSQEFLDERDEEWHEDYMAGKFDVVCTECKGQNVVDAIDWDSCTPEQQKAADDHYQELANSRAEAEAERRMGA
jgi:hypothetical protein